MVLGSFTGIRIGIGTVKGLAVSNNTPVIPISSLEGLAYNTKIEDGHICTLIDARNNQVYCGIFDKNYNLCTDYIADDINNVLPIVNKYENVIFVKDNTNIHASNIGIAAYNKYMQGTSFTADTIQPQYLKPSQAERMKKND
ncbi:MAG: tRNA (adenosine(37)-N6)-threonylcarbamoyltransferase complex dimerization subunit type 1 TsaB [Oscillospiraceae bacterium]|nr:tRNA (adenosine(37)-N6)-threonylcarbamoyltransferase complex dimerization subunit type 1 TsaB [Oscillospiraceae bacterium]